MVCVWTLFHYDCVYFHIYLVKTSSFLLRLFIFHFFYRKKKSSFRSALCCFVETTNQFMLLVPADLLCSSDWQAFFSPLLLSRTWVLWQRSWGSWGWRKAADLLSRWSGDFTYCNKQLGLQTQAWSSNTTFNFSSSTPSSLSLDKSTNHSNTVWLFRSVFYSVIYVTSLTRSRPMRGEEGVSCRAVAFFGVWNCNRKY